MRRRLLIAIAVAVLAPSAFPQAGKRAKTVQENANRQATLELERRGNLLIRDLTKRVKVDETRTTSLHTRLNELIDDYVKKNPPKVLDWGSPPKLPFGPIVELPEWKTVLEATLDTRELDEYRKIEQERTARLETARADFVQALVAAELRLTNDQRQALAAFCVRLSKKDLDTEGGWRGANIVGRVSEEDGQGERVLTRAQLRAIGEGFGRSAATELALEAERMRLLCKLDDKTARILGAAGQRVARAMAEEAAAKQAAEAAALAAATAAAKEKGEPPPKPPDPNADPKDPPNPFENPFWIKVCGSMLDQAKLDLLAANPAVNIADVREARTALALAELDEMLHLDPQQLDSLKELVKKSASAAISLGSRPTMFSLSCFGIMSSTNQMWYMTADPKQRGARQGLEDVLDRDQIDALKDQIIP